jgi:hypothetical protein
VYLKAREDIIYLFNVQKWCRNYSETTLKFIHIHSIQVKYVYLSNLEVSYVFLLLIISIYLRKFISHQPCIIQSLLYVNKKLTENAQEMYLMQERLMSFSDNISNIHVTCIKLADIFYELQLVNKFLQIFAWCYIRNVSYHVIT